MNKKNVCDVVKKGMPIGYEVENVEVFDSHGLDPGFIVWIKDSNGRSAKEIVTMSMSPAGLFYGIADEISKDYGHEVALVILAGYKALEKLGYTNQQLL